MQLCTWRTQRRVGHDLDAELLSDLTDLPLLEVGVALNLVDRNWNSGASRDSGHLLSVPVGYANGLGEAEVKDRFHATPDTGKVNAVIPEGLERC